MRVGLNLAFLTPGEMGGLEVYARQLTAALAAREDVELTLLLNEVAVDDPWWESHGHRVPVPVDPRRRVQWVRADQQLVPRLASGASVDVLHSLASTGPARGAFRRVVTIHDLAYLTHPETHFGGRSLGMRLLVPLAARRSHRVIAVSAATRDELVSRLGLDPDKVDVVPNGIGQPPKGDGRESARRMRERLDAGERPILLSVSAKRPHKNLSRLIAALSRLPSERRPLLVLPGYSTPHEEELRAEATARAVNGDVRFVGWMSEDELEGLYAVASGFIFPSLYEGFGMPVLEAMARGVPVATSGRASLAEVAGDAAVLFDPESEEEMAQAIERILGDTALSERLRASGLEQASRFSWERTAEGTVRAYERALAE